MTDQHYNYDMNKNNNKLTVGAIIAIIISCLIVIIIVILFVCYFRSINSNVLNQHKQTDSSIRILNF